MMRPSPVDRDAVTDRIGAVHQRDTAPMPVVPVSTPPLAAEPPTPRRASPSPTERSVRLARAADALHGHLAAAPARKRLTDAHLAAKLDALGVWPVLPLPDLATALEPVLIDARRLWDCRPADPERCDACGWPTDPDLCEPHKRVRYAWLDVLGRLAVRIVDEVPARAKRRTT